MQEKQALLRESRGWDGNWDIPRPHTAALLDRGCSETFFSARPRSEQGFTEALVMPHHTSLQARDVAV